MKRNLLLGVLGSLLCVGQVMADATITASPTVPAPGISGLNGSLWFDGTNSLNIAGATAIAAAGNPNATFHSTQINYNGGDASTAQGFLDSNGLTDGNTISPLGAQSTQIQTSVFEFKGYIDILSSDLTANVATIGLNHDDGGSVSIAGMSVLSNDCCGTNTANVTFSNGAGWYPIDVIYENTSYNGGTGGANVNLSIDGEIVPAAQFAITPEPSSIVAIVGLCGMGLIGLIRYRRRSASRNAG